MITGITSKDDVLLAIAGIVQLGLDKQHREFAVIHYLLTSIIFIFIFKYTKVKFW